MEEGRDPAGNAGYCVNHRLHHALDAVDQSLDEILAPLEGFPRQACDKGYRAGKAVLDNRCQPGKGGTDAGNQIFKGIYRRIL